MDGEGERERENVSIGGAGERNRSLKARSNLMPTFFFKDEVKRVRGWE